MDSLISELWERWKWQIIVIFIDCCYFLGSYSSWRIFLLGIDLIRKLKGIVRLGTSKILLEEIEIQIAEALPGLFRFFLSALICRFTGIKVLPFIIRIVIDQSHVDTVSLCHITRSLGNVSSRIEEVAALFKHRDYFSPDSIHGLLSSKWHLAWFDAWPVAER